jgi:hypothetical protein
LKVQSLKELQKLIQLCQKTGVTAIEVDGIKMNIRPLQEKSSKIDLNAFPEADIRVPAYTSIQAQDTQDEAIELKIDMPDELTDEQLLMWSSRTESPN